MDVTNDGKKPEMLVTVQFVIYSMTFIKASLILFVTQY